MPSPSACRIFLMAAWTRCSARAPATPNTPSTRCVFVRAASSTCPPLKAPPPARPPTVCVYGAESGAGASPDTRKAFLLLPPSLFPSSSSSFAIFTSTTPLTRVGILSNQTRRIWCYLDGLCFFFSSYLYFHFLFLIHVLSLSFYCLHFSFPTHPSVFFSIPYSFLPSFLPSGIQE